jgi:hypothetical protein
MNASDIRKSLEVITRNAFHRDSPILVTISLYWRIAGLIFDAAGFSIVDFEVSGGKMYDRWRLRLGWPLSGLNKKCDMT